MAAMKNSGVTQGHASLFALVAAPMIAPAAWFIFFLVKTAAQGQLTMAAAAWRMLFLVLFSIVSYTASIPVLLIMSRYVLLRHAQRQLMYLVIPVIAIAAGAVFSLPAFLDAPRPLQIIAFFISGAVLNIAAFLLLNKPAHHAGGSARAIAAISVQCRICFGAVALACGSAALLLSIAASYADPSYSDDARSYWRASRPNAISSPVSNVVADLMPKQVDALLPAVATPSTAFDLNERNMIMWLYTAAIMLSLHAIGAAAAAMIKREESLYLAGGTLCAIAAIAIIHIVAGLVLGLLAVAAAMVCGRIFHHIDSGDDTLTSQEKH